jgi:hypothetical protein
MHTQQNCVPEFYSEKYPNRPRNVATSDKNLITPIFENLKITQWGWKEMGKNIQNAGSISLTPPREG